MPFVYTVLVGIVAVTDRVKVTTGVTCPTVRYHPGIVTQMAETSTTLMEGRFALGIGSGENLNEHIFGDRLPPATVRIERMREAIDLIRKLWMGEVIDHYGTHYIVEEARTFLLPETLPPIIASATGAIAAKVAADRRDQLILPLGEPGHVLTVLDAFRAAGGTGKPLHDPDLDLLPRGRGEGGGDRLRVVGDLRDQGQLNRELPDWKHSE